MRLIDADELLERVGRDRLDSRERIAQMIKNAPTVSNTEQIRAEIEVEIKVCETAIDMFKVKPDMVFYYKTLFQAYTKVLQIIDKYTKGEIE